MILFCLKFLGNSKFYFIWLDGYFVTTTFFFSRYKKNSSFWVCTSMVQGFVNPFCFVYFVMLFSLLNSWFNNSARFISSLLYSAFPHSAFIVIKYAKLIICTSQFGLSTMCQSHVKICMPRGMCLRSVDLTYRCLRTSALSKNLKQSPVGKEASVSCFYDKQLGKYG